LVLLLLRQIFGGIARFVANRGMCRNKLRRKIIKYFETLGALHIFAVSKGTNKHPDDKEKNKNNINNQKR